jgi:pimeloyl-ACP methyl ester carboxylesterase
MRTYSDDAIAVMDSARVERAHVIGASMGGMIAQHVALDHPERVRSLTLACTTAGGSRGKPPWRLFASMAARPLVGLERTFPIVAPLLYSEATRADPKKLADDLALRTSDATPLATAPGQFSAIARHDTRKRLGELEMPVLVLHGEEDKLVPPAAGGKLAERIPDARLVTLPGTGHVLTTDDEEGTAGAIREFLDEVEEAEEPASEAGLRGVARR